MESEWTNEQLHQRSFICRVFHWFVYSFVHPLMWFLFGYDTRKAGEGERDRGRTRRFHQWVMYRAKSPPVYLYVLSACEIILRVAKCRPRFESLGKSYQNGQKKETGKKEQWLTAVKGKGRGGKGKITISRWAVSLIEAVAARRESEFRLREVTCLSTRKVPPSHYTVCSLP